MEITSQVSSSPLPLGFRFCPYEVELVSYYLTNKSLNKPFKDPTNRFQELDLYNYTPEQLREIYGVQREREMYIFVKKLLKHRTGKRLKRTTTNNGHWRASMKEKEIRLDNNELVGHKRNLVYYTGKGRETKTNWRMQEYRLPYHKMLDDWRLCKVYLNGKEEIKTKVNLGLASHEETAEQSTAMMSSNNDIQRQDSDKIMPPYVGSITSDLQVPEEAKSVSSTAMNLINSNGGIQWLDTEQIIPSYSPPTTNDWLLQGAESGSLL